MYQICLSENKVIPIFYDELNDAKKDAVNQYKYRGVSCIKDLTTGQIVWEMKSKQPISPFVLE
jgi:hypothetical protein